MKSPHSAAPPKLNHCNQRTRDQSLTLFFFICEIFKQSKGISAMFGLLYYTHGVHLISFTVFVACSLTLPTSKVVGISLCALKKQMRSFLTTSHKCFETHLSAKCFQTHLNHMLFLLSSRSFIWDLVFL